MITQFIIDQLRTYEKDHLEKFFGIALPSLLVEKCPALCSRMWAELDIVPFVLDPHGPQNVEWVNMELWRTKTLDERAESIARKCIT